MNARTTVLIFCILALAGCNTTRAPVSQTSAAPTSTVQQQAPTQEVKIATHKSSPATQSDANTNSTNASLQAVALVSAILAASGKSSSHSAADYAGTWNVSTEEHRICQMTLQPFRSNSPQAQVQASGCFGKLFGVSRWSLRGHDVILSDAFGALKATLRAKGRNQLDGDGVSMWR